MTIATPDPLPTCMDNACMELALGEWGREVSYDIGCIKHCVIHFIVQQETKVWILGSHVTNLFLKISLCTLSTRQIEHSP